MSGLLKKTIHDLLNVKVKGFIANREITLSGRQKLSVYLYASCILIGAIPLILLATGRSEPLFICANAILWDITAILFAAYCKKWISLDAATIMLAIFVQIEISFEIVHCATVSYPDAAKLILADLFLSLLVVLLAAIAYLRYLPYILSAMSIGAYIYGMIMINDPFLKNFSAVFCFIFLIVCMLGSRILKNISKLARENEGLRSDEKELLWILKMNKEQVHAFIDLSKDKTPPDTEELLDLVGENVRHNIIKTVTAYLKWKAAETSDLQHALPELTPSEREICSLILQDKKQSDICLMLDKTPSNVNSQRAHIRKKLGLSAQDNLQEALKKRIGIR